MTVAIMLKSKGPDIISVAPRETIASAVALLAKMKIGAVVVCGPDGELIGILSERDIVRGLGEHGTDVMGHTVESLMTANVKTCTVHDTADGLMQRMTEGRFRHMPVLDDNGKLAGVISIGDVVKRRISQLESETEAMREYISGHG
ncbi:CBS domain-containing protein [Hwanghaeella sp.]|uniref:CBS domain-containing protein n=1 Tax=Hwanghaeella sp. TaxID=2605943 RepID=UPI003CCC01BF